MKKRIKQFITTILSVILVLSFVLPHQTLAANFEKPILNYVALGDSLAAGYLNDKSRGGVILNSLRRELKAIPLI